MDVEHAIETENDDEKGPPEHSGEKKTPPSADRKVNSKGLTVLKNGVVSMLELELCLDRPAKSRDPNAPKLFDVQ